MSKTNGAGDQGAPFKLPADLTGLTDPELAEIRAQAEAEFDAIYDQDGGPKADQLARAQELSDALDTITADETRRRTEADETAEKFQALREKHTPAATSPEGEPGDDPADGTGGAEGAEGAPAAAPVGEPVAASGRPTSSTRAVARELGGLNPGRPINPSLSGARRQAPAVAAPAQSLALTASSDLPGRLSQGQAVTDLDTLVDLVHHQARSLPVTRSGGKFDERGKFDPDGPYGGRHVAGFRNSYPDVVEYQTPRDVVAPMIKRLTNPAVLTDALVAGGGWCAPSEIRYDFFNVACADGAVDLPTFGVQRGGLRWPVSPSLADTFSPAIAPFGAAFSNATVPWLWTEGDDISTVTGNPNKPCIRVPCADMDEARLECYGICLTAGNLADDAWPEATRNFLALLMSAFERAKNTRYLATMISGSTTMASGCAGGQGTAAPLLGMMELGAVDYRTRYGMCRTDPIEVVISDWALSMVRSDLAKRTGVSDFMCVTDAQIAAWLDCRNIRAQFVQDYQVRASGFPGFSTPITAWPTSAEFLLYAPGTWARGNGMTLDLGVVRDSTLNAENDHTAAWMEECHLIAMLGHASRRYSVNLCTDGTTGAADLTSCCP